jgi:hypothetical protein
LILLFDCFIAALAGADKASEVIMDRKKVIRCIGFFLMSGFANLPQVGAGIGWLNDK